MYHRLNQCIYNRQETKDEFCTEITLTNDDSVCTDSAAVQKNNNEEKKYEESPKMMKVVPVFLGR